ncbi:hypothetical protein Tco_0567551 [Tanacetum coccineum]
MRRNSSLLHNGIIDVSVVSARIWSNLLKGASILIADKLKFSEAGQALLLGVAFGVDRNVNPAGAHCAMGTEYMGSSSANPHDNNDSYGKHGHRLHSAITLEADVARKLSSDTDRAYKEVERLDNMGEDDMPILQMAEESCKKCLSSAKGGFFARLKDEHLLASLIVTRKKWSSRGGLKYVNVFRLRVWKYLPPSSCKVITCVEGETLKQGLFFGRPSSPPIRDTSYKRMTVARPLDTRVATLDEIVAALESGQ